MPTYRSSDYKLSAVKYYLSHSQNQVHTCQIFGCSTLLHDSILSFES